jgi:ubiquinone/menaquinone biosynthesis C-methylase UbiE
MEQFNSIKKIDLGCGPKKTQGALGVDHFPYPGVDVVFDLNKFPWPLNDNLFETVYASHVIEHINFIPEFMREIHRISKHQADVHIITPHFSSLDSWKDPTHRWHLSMEWYAVFCNPDSYLTKQIPGFELISSYVKFSNSLRSIKPKIIHKLFGQKTWEKHYSFRYPARNIHTTLRVVKKRTDEV